MRRFLPVGLPILAVLAVLAGCSSDAKGTGAKVAPLNPSPLAHLTYDCSILDSVGPAIPSGPLIYLEPFDDGGSGQSRMCAIDWNGKLRRQLEKGLASQQSADGSRLLVVDYPVTSVGPTPYIVLDEKGQVLDRLTEVWNAQAIWADDNRRLCYIADSDISGHSGLANLYERIPGQPGRRVESVGAISYLPPVASTNGGGLATPFVSGPEILACSVATDRVVLLNPATGTVSVRRLSDGVELRAHFFGHSFYPFHNPVGVERLVVSRDGRYLADNVEGAQSVPVLDLTVDAPGKMLIARVVAGFSADDSLAVIQRDDKVVQVVNWQSGRIVRELAGTYPYAFAGPLGTDMLVGLPSTRHQFGLDLYIVHGDGTSFEVARSVEVTGR